MTALGLLLLGVSCSTAAVLWWWSPISPPWFLTIGLAALAGTSWLINIYQYFGAREQALKQRRLRHSLHQRRADMARLVDDRTLALAQSNRQLSTEMRLNNAYTRALQQSEQKLQLAMHASHLAVWDWDINHRTLTIDGPDGAFGQRSQGELLSLRQFVHPDDFPQVRRAIMEHLKGRSARLVLRYRTNTAEPRWVEDIGRTISYDARRRPGRVLGTRRDITNEVTRERELTLAASLFNGTRDPLLVLDTDFRVTAMNPAFSDMIRRSPAEWINHAWQHCSHSELIERISDSLQQRGHWEGDILEKRADGTAFPLFMSIRSVYAGSKVEHYLCFCRDLSLQQSTTTRKLDHFDALTGLPNRDYFHQHLDYYRRMDRLPTEQLALGLLNLDGFQHINTTHGHATGDQMLEHIAARLNQYGAPLIMVARLTGDEFALLFSHYETAERLKHLAMQIVQDIHRPLMLEHAEVLTSASLGLVVLDQNNVHQCLSDARSALQEAKINGGNQVVLAGQPLQYTDAERATIAGYLKDILANLQTPLLYLTQFEPTQGLPYGIRAHAVLGDDRQWQRDEPLFQLARERQLEDRLLHQLLSEAIRTLQSITVPALYATAPVLSFPVSGMTASQEHFSSVVLRAIKDARCAAHRVEISLLAHHLDTSRYEAILKQLALLRDHGVQISMECLGCTNLSLDELSRLPLTTLRVGYAMLQARRTNQQTHLLLGVAQQLEWHIAVTGIVSVPTPEVLAELDICSLEGPFYVEPLKGETLNTYLQHHNDDTDQSPLLLH
ncbi:diguanylate cyclase [Salinispirillum sp. LH 10-3-1]|uniref:Diguanylate cyclase n=1 Tax=Salinispirillum sp. LH 10-3-1 TaxID=2952525 RepID=A0AB38YFJ5_9GAMM